jgi:SAM-dependent methyltransferase
MLSCYVYGAQPQINEARLLLTHLRDGDYAHAGDKKAIDLVISKLLEISPQAIKGPCLDVGSGFGGTANYLYQSYSSPICGIDLDQAAIKYAQQKYPEIPFINGDAHQVSEFFNQEYFSLIYLFNVLYAIEDKLSLLKQLSQIAKSDAILTIFDYTTEQPSLHLNDLAGKPMHPIMLRKLESDLKQSGWELIEITDLTSYFLIWYQELLQKLEEERPALSLRFSDSDIMKVRTTFCTIEGWLSSSLLGGVVIFAKRSSL